MSKNQLDKKKNKNKKHLHSDVDRFVFPRFKQTTSKTKRKE